MLQSSALRVPFAQQCHEPCCACFNKGTHHDEGSNKQHQVQEKEDLQQETDRRGHLGLQATEPLAFTQRLQWAVMLCALLHELAEELKLSTHHVTLALMPWQAAGSTSASRCTLTKVQPLFMPQGLEGRALLP